MRGQDRPTKYFVDDSCLSTTVLSRLPESRHGGSIYYCCLMLSVEALQQRWRPCEKPPTFEEIEVYLGGGGGSKINSSKGTGLVRVFLRDLLDNK